MLVQSLRRWVNVILALGHRVYDLPTQQTRDIEPLLIQCWASVVDGGPTLNQQWLNVACLLGSDEKR